MGWHTASLSSEPAVARVTPLFSKKEVDLGAPKSAMVFVPEDEFRLLDCGGIIWKNSLRRTASSQSSCCTQNSEEAVMQKLHPNTPLLFLVSFASRAAGLMAGSRDSTASAPQKWTRAHSVSCQRGSGEVTSARGMRQTARQVQL